VRLDGERAKLGHGAEHREQLAVLGSLRQGLERGQHRFGAGVVGVVDDHHTLGGLVLLESVCDEHIGERRGAFLEPHPRELSGGKGRQRVACLMATFERQVERDILDGELTPALGGGRIVLATEVTGFESEAHHRRGGHPG